MFGFGKKTLTDQMMAMIAIEIAMFESWYSEKYNKMLPDHEIGNLAKNILERENFKHTDEQVNSIKLTHTVGFPEDQVKQLRVQHNFDNQVKGFCRSVNSEHLL